MNRYNDILEMNRIRCEVNNRVNLLRLFRKEKSQEGKERFDKRYDEFMSYMRKRYGEDEVARSVVYASVKQIYRVNL